MMWEPAEGFLTRVPSLWECCELMAITSTGKQSINNTGEQLWATGIS